MNVPLPMLAKGLARRLYPKCSIPQKSAFTCMNRQFNSESSYHEKADDALNKIQDTLEFYFEDNPQLAPNTDINFSSGVLTIGLPHGTWVLNKQTPNQQIWWSSPISGPRRYEYDEANKKWIWTRYVDFESVETKNDAKVEWKDTKHLGEALKTEMIDLYKIEKGLEDLDEI